MKFKYFAEQAVIAQRRARRIVSMSLRNWAERNWLTILVMKLVMKYSIFEGTAFLSVIFFWGSGLYCGQRSKSGWALTIHFLKIDSFSGGCHKLMFGISSCKQWCLFYHIIWSVCETHCVQKIIQSCNALSNSRLNISCNGWEHC